MARGEPQCSLRKLMLQDLEKLLGVRGVLDPDERDLVGVDLPVNFCDDLGRRGARRNDQKFVQSFLAR